ncbi:MAG: PQQ-binding-like beta-propeller repeat protein [Armatimonadetes bacterium]|nr:PQQ-binding-like beta-propeller repeat protein [Armatimonadota bacterium]
MIRSVQHRTSPVLHRSLGSVEPPVVDTVEAAPQPPPDLGAARKLFSVDLETDRHIVHAFPIEDVRQSKDKETYYYPPEPLFTPQGMLVVGTHRGEILAFDPGRGKQLWSFDTGKESAYNQPVASLDGRLYLSNHRDAELLCLDPDGLLAFRAVLPESAERDPQVDDQGRAYVVTERHLVALDAAGTERWKLEVPGADSAVAVAPDGRPMLVSREGTVRVFKDDGSVAWTHRCAAPLTQMPCLAEESVFVATEAGLEVLDWSGRPRPGPQLPELPAIIKAPPVGDVQTDPEGNVIVATPHGWIVKLDSQGRELGRRDIRTGITSRPRVQPDGTVLVPGADARIYVLSRALEWENLVMVQSDYGGRTPSLRAPLVGPTGHMYVDQGSTRLEVFDPHGNPVWEFKGEQGFHRVSAGFSPSGMLAAADYGHVYLLKERTSQEVLAEQPPEEPAAPKIRRRGEWLFVGGVAVPIKRQRL